MRYRRPNELERTGGLNNKAHTQPNRSVPVIEHLFTRLTLQREGSMAAGRVLLLLGLACFVASAYGQGYFSFTYQI